MMRLDPDAGPLPSFWKETRSREYQYRDQHLLCLSSSGVLRPRLRSQDLSPALGSFSSGLRLILFQRWTWTQTVISCSMLGLHIAGRRALCPEFCPKGWSLPPRGLKSPRNSKRCHQELVRRGLCS